jgi:hypothetical protein
VSATKIGEKPKEKIEAGTLTNTSIPSANTRKVAKWAQVSGSSAAMKKS